MTAARKPTETQRQVLANAKAGRRLDEGRAFTQSAAAGWGCSIDSCVRNGWLDREYRLTEAGSDALRGEPRYRCKSCGRRVQVRVAIGSEKAIAYPYKHKRPGTDAPCDGYDVIEEPEQ